MNKKRTVAFVMFVSMLFSIGASSAVTAVSKYAVMGTYVTKSTADSSSDSPAVVILTDENGRIYKAQTEETGNIGTYTVDVPNGTYDIEISKKGYLDYDITGVRVVNRNIAIPELAVLPGDLNDDGRIDTKDIIVFLRGFNTDERYADIRKLADIDADGTLTVADLGYLKPNYDTSKENYEWTSIMKLQTDYRNDPMGIDFTEPEFNWIMESTKRGEKQTAYRIGVATTYDKAVNGEYDVWDSGKVLSNITHSYYGKDTQSDGKAPEALLPRTEYFWTVTSYNAEGKEIPAAQIAKFETGLFGDFGEDNKWIALGQPEGEAAPFCTLTEGTVEMNLTCTNSAIGVWFGSNEDETQRHMWYFQIGGTIYNGGAHTFVPHFSNNGSFSIGGKYDLSSLGLATGQAFDVKLEIAGGIVKTYVNGTYICDYTLKGSGISIGKIDTRLSGSDDGIINYYTIKDSSGEIFYTNHTSAPAEYCTLEEGTLEMNLTCNDTAIGVWLWTSEDEAQRHMWYFQVGGTLYNSGKPALVPHYNNNGGWKVGSAVDLSSLGLSTGVAFDVRIEFTDGVAKTYVNGTHVSDYALQGENKSIGLISTRFSGKEAGTINHYTITDTEGNIFYTNKQDNGENVSEATELASVYFRKQFTLSQPADNIAKARLYSTAAGNQIMYMNGKRASNDYMAPGKSQYTALLYYQTYDVTELILEGQNTVAAEVGQGWYNAGAVQAKYGTNVGLRAKLVITYNDGAEQVIDTDSTWQSTNEGPTYLNRYYDGQKVDGRKHIDGWNDNDCSYDEWCNVIAKDTFITTNSYTLTDSFVAENMNPVRNTHTFNPTSVWELDDGSFIYRFDQNIVGTARITAKAPRGTHITLYYAEALKNGNCVDRNTSTYLNHNGVDEYIFRGDEDGETVEFDLVYHGFQHIQIFGLDKALPLDQIEGLVLTSDMYETGRFESSNETLDRYMENIMWSIRGNFVSTLTDCPTREKNTWTGDAQLFAPTAAFFSDIFNHYRNFETMVSGSQYGDGGIPELVPSMVPHSEKSTGTVTKTPSGWADCIIFIPWEMYNQYGDVSIIKDNYEEMKKWIDFLMTKKIYFKGDTTKTLPYYINPETADYLRVDGNYGDHVAYYRGNKDIGYRENEYNTTTYKYHETSFSEIGTAVTAYSCKILGKMAQVIGEYEDAQYYAELSEKFAEAWRLNFVAEDGYTSLSGGKTTVTNVDGVDVYSYNPNVKRTYSGKEYDNIGSQTSYCMGLFFDLYETDEKKQKAAENLVKLLEYENYNMTVGYMGINYLFPVLSQAGYFDVALRTFENENYPSILAMVKMGATSIWEDYAGSMSQNHYIYGAPGRWIYTDILGIGHNYKDGNAGFDHFELNPHYGEYDGTKLTWAKGSYDSVNGLIKSDWSISDDKKIFTYNCTVPANTSATLSLPVESENAVITEGSIPIEEAEGIEYVKTENGRRYYEITSGVYEFVVENDKSAS